jgi:hypothetical protein
MNATGLYPATDRDHAGRIMYCGRFALIAATGKSSREVTTAINMHRRKKHDKHVGVTDTSDLRAALQGMGYKVAVDRTYERDTQPTLSQWRKKEQHGRDAVYVVLVTNHWVTVRGDWLVDTNNATPVDMSRKNPYARKRVQSVIRIIGA